MIRTVALWGGSGRMGQALQKLLDEGSAEAKGLELVQSLSGKSDEDLAALAQAAPDLIIDFSAPTASLRLAQGLGRIKSAVLIGSTGFTEAELAKLRQSFSAGKVPWALVSNTSIGVFALGQALRAALKVLPEDYSVEIIEAHHAQKKDAPSGTAKSLLATVKESRKGDVPVHSLRGGTEAGEHRIVILGAEERLEFSHHAQSRALFARGALRLIKRLAEKPARAEAYRMDELV